MESSLNDAEKAKVYIASGFAHPELARGIAERLGVEAGPVVEKIHPNGEIYSRYDASVRGRRVFIVQPHLGNEKHTVNDAIIQQCLLADAARSSSAREITAVSPYFGYTRQDRKSRGREPIGVRVVTDMLISSGVNRFVAVDMHSGQTQGLFRGPFDHLTAQPLLREGMLEEINNYDLAECMVIAPDAGASKLAERHRRELGTALLYLAKMRDPLDGKAIRPDEKVPEVDGRVCMVFDDMIDTAGTIVTAAEALKNSGAKAVYVAATHPIFSDPAIERLREAPIDKILVADTFPTTTAQAELGDKLRVISIAPMIGEAIIEIVQDGSVSRIFKDQNHM